MTCCVIALLHITIRNNISPLYAQYELCIATITNLQTRHLVSGCWQGEGVRGWGGDNSPLYEACKHQTSVKSVMVCGALFYQTRHYLPYLKLHVVKVTFIDLHILQLVYDRNTTT